MRKILLSVALAASLAACSTAPIVATPAAGTTIKKAELDRLVTALPAAAQGSFSEFLAQAARENSMLRASVAAYAARKPLAGDDLVNISRLLGLYNLLHHQAAVIDATA